MIALQTAMACHYWLFSYYKLLPLLPFCHDLLGKHRKQVGAAEVCGYEVFGGGGGGEALVQQAVLVLRKWLWLKKQSKGMWQYQDKNHLSVQCRLFCTDITRGIFKHWLLSWAHCSGHFRCQTMVRISVFPYCSHSRYFMASFYPEILESLRFLGSPIGCGRVEHGRDEVSFPPSGHYWLHMWRSHITGHPQMVSSCCLQYLFKAFYII